MPFTPDTPLRGAPRGSADALATWAIDRGCKRPDDVRSYLETVYDLAPVLDLNPDIVVVQSIHETTEGGVPWASHWWQERCNPAGLGITGNKLQNEASRDFRHGEAAARAHLLHLSLYVHGTDVPEGFSTEEDPRWEPAVRAGFAGVARTLRDLVNTWAMDAVEPDDPKTYADKIAGRLEALEAAGLLAAEPRPDRPDTGEAGPRPDTGPGRPPIARPAPDGYTKHMVPGLANPLYLPDWIKVEIRIISHPRFRAGQKISTHTKTTWHDTGNPNTNAEAEWKWANDGRPGAGKAGYHGIFDDRKVIITLPFDELAWHAFNSEGDRTSYAFEQAWGGSIDFARSMEVGCHLHGAVCAAKGWEVDTALVQHNHWRRPDGTHKNCPGQIRRRNMWSLVEKQTSEAAARVRSFAGDAGPEPVTSFAAPAPIQVLDEISRRGTLAPFHVQDPSSGATFIWIGDRVRATRRTGRFKFADTGGERVGPDLEPGAEFDVDFIFQHGGRWWFYTPYGTRILADDVERISDTKGAA